MPNYRTRRDALLAANVSLPNANATTTSGFLDLGQANGFPVNESIDLELAVPAEANLANTKTITFTIQHADVALAANAAAISKLGTITLTGGASGGAATTTQVKLPGDCKQFLRVSALGGADAGTTLTTAATLRILS